MLPFEGTDPVSHASKVKLFQKPIKKIAGDLHCLDPQGNLSQVQNKIICNLCCCTNASFKPTVTAACGQKKRQWNTVELEPCHIHSLVIVLCGESPVLLASMQDQMASSAMTVHTQGSLYASLLSLIISYSPKEEGRAFNLARLVFGSFSEDSSQGVKSVYAQQS